MEVLEKLAILAQIAATYAGFIAIFVALGQASRFAPSDAHFVRVLVLSSVITIAASLTPILLEDMVPLGPLWARADAGAFGAGLVVMFYVARHQLGLPEDEANQIPVGWHLPGWGFGGLAALVYLAGALQLLPAAPAYAAGTACVLMTSVWCFVAVVFRRFF